MENKKNYVYKLCQSGWVFSNLEGAISGAYYDMKKYAERVLDRNRRKWVKATCSTPVVTKVRGGYKVQTITSIGTVLSRRIDVFEPEYIEPKLQCNYELLKNSKTLH
jgi:hypothetical protein